MINSQIHKRINFNFGGQKLIFDTSRELFSFARIDKGTVELLNSLRKNEKINYDDVLDLGCGYGPIGIFLKNKFPGSSVVCSDRDSLAIDFATHNASLNRVEIRTILSLDFENINKKFSLIICNFPAKLEKNGLEHFIAKSSEHLEKNGTLAIVIVKELEKSMSEILSSKNIDIDFRDSSLGYIVYHLRFNNKIKSGNNPYSLSEKIFTFKSKKIKILTSSALQEFDTIHFLTELILEKITDSNFSRYKTISIISPNQGLIPVFISHLYQVDKLILNSRDLFQLGVSSKNLELNKINNFEILNSDFLNSKSDLLIWSLRDEDHKTIIEKLKIYRKNFKKILLGGRLQVVKRIIKKENIIISNAKTKGKYTLVEI